MPSPEPIPSAHDLTEDLVLALPAHHRGSWWFGPLQATPVTLHYDPEAQRFRCTDAKGRDLPLERCAAYGADLLEQAQQRLLRLQATRKGITERLRRSSPPPPPPSPAPPVALPVALPVAAPVAAPSTQVAAASGSAAVPDDQVEVSPFSDEAPPLPAPRPSAERTTSVFRRRKTSAVDVIARMKRQTDRFQPPSR